MLQYYIDNITFDIITFGSITFGNVHLLVLHLIVMSKYQLMFTQFCLINILTNF